MNKVAIYKSDNYKYPRTFRPSEKYPEYRFEDISAEDNKVYHSVRECFRMLGLDAERFGSPEWNPLGEYVNPGDNVLIKPNLVMDVNFNKQGGTDCLYTNPSVVAVVIDYVVIALNGTGRIVVGDAPMQECNFENLCTTSRYGDLIDYYKKKELDIELVDFRELTSVVSHGVYKSTVKDDAKGRIVNIGKESEFYGAEPLQEERVRITNYDPRILPKHHSGETQEYYVSQYVLDADVIINMPKPKSHRKAGITGALKNFVGANVRKEFLPHHTQGSQAEGGDEYLNKNLIRKVQSKLLDKRNIQRAEKRYKMAAFTQYIIRGFGIALKMTNNKYMEGSWYGNHTISRTICDLNKIVFYADKEGVMQFSKQRRMFIVGDMIVSGEKEGPVNPSPKNVGIIAMADSPLQFDEAVATIMGFDIKKIPTFSTVRGYKGKFMYHENGAESEIISNDVMFNRKKLGDFRYCDTLQFEPTSGWKDHIEL